jgi:DNA-binding response OmpR family regulator
MTAALAEQHHQPDAIRLRHGVVWDSDPEIVGRVARALRDHGHDVHAVGCRDEAAACLAHHRPDLLVVGFRTTDDLRQLQRLRAAFDGPIVCYSYASATRDRIRLLAFGVDDVVPSPLSYEELALRVRAVARRAEIGNEHQRGPLTCGPVTADRGTHQVLVRGDWVQLTAVEFSLLAFLMGSPRVAYTRRELLRQVWGYEIGDTSTVSVHIRRLRRKLERDATRPELIRTVWGSGYYFDPSVD